MLSTLPVVATSDSYQGAPTAQRSAARAPGLTATALALLALTGACLAGNPVALSADARPSGDELPVTADVHTTEPATTDTTLAGLDMLYALGDAELVSAIEQELDGTVSPMNSGPNTYRRDPRWGADGVTIDRFSGINNGRYRGRSVAQLSTGQIVVATLNTWPEIGNQLGLVKLNGRGQRVAWTSPGSYGHFNNEYIRYPNSGTAQPNVYEVHDVKVGPNDYIYVLVTRRFVESGETRYAPAIAAFRPSGSFAGAWTYSPDGQIDNDAVAMDIRGNQMVVLGRRGTPGTVSGGFWTMRQTIESNGSLSLVANSISVFSTPGGYGESEPASIAFRRNNLLYFGNLPFYVAFTARTPASTPFYAPCLTRISASNTVDTTYGTNGVSCHAINGLWGETDRAIDVQTVGFSIGTNYTEDLFMLTRETRLYRDGFGLLKLRNGTPDTAFGPSGGRAYGGCTAETSGTGEGCATTGTIPFPARTHQPLALALGAGTLGVVGTSVGPTNPAFFGAGQHSWFARIDANNGALNHLRRIQPTDFVSPHQLAGITHVGGNQFIATGDTPMTGIGDENARTMFTTKMVPTNDIIFFNGFQN